MGGKPLAIAAPSDTWRNLGFMVRAVSGYARANRKSRTRHDARLARVLRSHFAYQIPTRELVRRGARRCSVAMVLHRVNTYQTQL